MKIHHLFIILCLSLFASSASSAQAQKANTIEFPVSGNCNMCKKSIESSLEGKPGISAVSWNKGTKFIKVTFDPAMVAEEQIHQQIADAGYDTEKKKANDKSYKALPACCKYERTLHADAKQKQ